MELYQTSVTKTAFSGLFRGPHAHVDPLHHAGPDDLRETPLEVGADMGSVTPTTRVVPRNDNGRACSAIAGPTTSDHAAKIDDSADADGPPNERVSRSSDSPTGRGSRSRPSPGSGRQVTTASRLRRG